MEKRERKQNKKKRSVWLWIILGLLIAAVCLWFFVFDIAPLPKALESALNPAEVTPAPTATPEPTSEPTPEPTIYIPRPEVNVYTAKLTRQESIMQGSLRVHYLNNTSDTVFAVPFHLYPNSITPGVLKVQELSLDGKKAYFTIEEDLLNVPLAVELAPDEDCVIYMEFTIDMYLGDYGRDGRLPYILPAVGVYENGWLTDALPEDVTYTAPSTYSVIIEGDAVCSLPESAPGHYYGENIQGLTVTLK